MPRRYLFGPVSRDFADQMLFRQRRAGDCLAFNAAGDADLAVGPADSWDDVCGRLPAGWRPDFLALYLPYRAVPPGLWAAPLPVLGLAGDWNLLWHYYRLVLPCCDLVLTDTAGVEALARQGLGHARPAVLYGCERSWLAQGPGEEARDLDVLFAGNLNAAVQRERLPWLGRLARLAGRWRVTLRTNVFGPEYRQLLGRARVVFNRAIRGEANARAFEAAAAGALLFQERGNREAPAFFRDRRECVYYGPDDLEDLLTYYLEHEEERRALAEAGRARVVDYSFEALWDRHLGLVEAEWAGMVQRSQERLARGDLPRHPAPTWELLHTPGEGTPAVVAGLRAALAEQPRSATLHNALGVLLARSSAPTPQDAAQAVAAAAEHFRRASEADPFHGLAGLHLAEVLARLGRKDEAVRQARRTIERLDRGDPPESLLQEPILAPVRFDPFRVEWERCGWANTGDPRRERAEKATLLRWCLHSLLAEQTGDLAHHYEAAAARPDLPATRSALGRVLARQGRDADAARHLREALADQPFDGATARALYEVLGRVGDVEGREELARQRRLLFLAAPQLVTPEEWFATS